MDAAPNDCVDNCVHVRVLVFAGSAGRAADYPLSAK